MLESGKNIPESGSEEKITKTETSGDISPRTSYVFASVAFKIRTLKGVEEWLL